MKKSFSESIKPQFTMFIAFVVSMMVAYLLVAHFQHTILRAWIGTTTQTSQSEFNDEVAAATPTYASNQTATGDDVCGCAFCCG
ncbi:MAG: hypothetical protein LC687_03395 [Actinobacteria bacterium]|nr:hypothetical protein [Actinomycetota bacterium]